MLTKLKSIEENYVEKQAQLGDPAVYADPALLKKLQKECKELRPVVEAYRAYVHAEKDTEEAESLLSDPELHDVAQEEFRTGREKMEQLRRELRRLLLPRDPNDEKNVVMEIRGGVGGEEGNLFAADLFRMYSLYAEKQGWKVEVVSANETEMGGFKELSCIIEGDGAYSRLKFEAGTHRVQRVPETESQGRIHPSAATVAVLPEAEEVAFDIDPKDLQIDTYRSSGAGGQHVNKTESAIRITHLPTGMVVECQDERSQYKNKDRAMKILRTRLMEAEREKQDAEYAARRKRQIGGAERAEKIRTYRFQEKIVVDHRLNGENKTMSVTAFLDGDMDAVIDALTLAEQAQLLENVNQ